MQLPEKVFGLSWLELRHAELDLAFCFDCTMALRRWAQLSLDMINDRRAGRPAWSGWTCDASELQQAWEQSIWAEEGGRYHRREEWNWVYRTDYQGTVHVGAAADHSRKRAIAAQQHKLIRLKRSDGQGGGDVGERELAWVECDAASAAECEGEPEQWDEQEALCERSMKLYEDHLAEMGLSRCCLRFREFEHGWEIRLRWWSCLNPGCEPKRGLPHARLRETTIRLRYGAACAARRTEERSLYFPGGESQRGGDYEGGASLDADEMRGAMELDGPPTTALLELAAPSRATAAPPAVVCPAPDDGAVAARHIASLGAPCTCVVAGRGDALAFSAAGSGRVVLVDAGGGLRWGVAHREVEALAFDDLHAALLSCGSDGCVRSWRLEDGSGCGVAHVDGPDADRAHDGLALVQGVAVHGAALAAACGRAVFTFTRLRDDFSQPIARPPLPSTVTTLGYAGGSLVAGTMHSGIFVWHPSELAHPTSGPSLLFECRSSITSVASSDGELFVAWCGDRLVKVWEPPAVGSATTAGEAKRTGTSPALCTPMSFGGLVGTSGKSSQVVSCAATCAGGVPQTPSRLLVIANGAFGLITWSLDDVTGRIDANLGIDSALSQRSLLPHRRSALCVSLCPPCGAPPRLACGCDDGVLLLLELNSSAADGATGTVEWRVRREWSLGTRAPVTLVAWAPDGAWLCAASSAEGAVFAAECPHH